MSATTIQQSANEPSASVSGGVSKASSRLTSIDAYRGLVMLLMLGECLHLCAVAASSETGPIWDILCYHQSHVAWRGCSLHDLIQPSFTFLVGVSLPFSIASRRKKGQSIWRMSLHALWRSILLVFLGIFLRSVGRESTYFTFEDTLTQIGLGYFILFAFGFMKPWVHWLAVAAILFCYGWAFYEYPLPAENFDWQEAGVAADWEHNEEGMAAHWNKNTNLAWDFDRWFLNLFPREETFRYNSGGYATLSFIPTLATMLLGLIAGSWMFNRATIPDLLARLAATGAILLLLGLAADMTGICPNVKRIWTPSWVLFSGGACFLILMAFHLFADRLKLRWLFWVFVVVGANSIAAYVMGWLVASFVRESLVTHFGSEIFATYGDVYYPLVLGAAELLALWLILFVMYRSKIFLKI